MTTRRDTDGHDAVAGIDTEAEISRSLGDPADYPGWWRTHTVLADGATVEIRPIKPSDRDALAAFHRRQSKESVYFRFFQPRPELSNRELDFFTRVDYRSRMAFVAIEGGELMAVARYESGTTFDPSTDNESEDDGPRPGPTAAEVAFFVDDANHGRGLATLLLEYLAAAARANGLSEFTASVLPENYRMLGVFRAAGFTATTRFADGVIEVSINLRPTAEAVSTIAVRRQRATHRSLGPLLDPEVVAIVGAGRRPGSLGHELLMSA
ncbi:MAG: GNAT family N-acetyltransferase, partial [Acidimicrobiia bacterium]|nr:GNAT family N-acetyltransferase [Acidimicrobiia bacterium]